MAFELAVALDGEENGTHLIALGKDDFFKLALVEFIEQPAELAHRLPDGRELVVRDLETRGLDHPL